MDEANQAMEPEALIPITIVRGKVVLVGGKSELMPIFKNQEVASNRHLDPSMFTRLLSLIRSTGRSKIAHETLYTQYRMVREMNSFLDFGYSSEANQRKFSWFPWPVADIPIVFIGFQDPEKEQETEYERDRRNRPKQSKKTKGNRQIDYSDFEESKLVKRVLSFLSKNMSPQDIGVVPPYPDPRMNRKCFKVDSGVEVNFVDGFQGREKEFIIYSCMKRDDKGYLEYVHEDGRINVAMSRARSGLVIIGCPKKLESEKHFWGSFLTKFKQKGILVDQDFLLPKPKPDVFPCHLRSGVTHQSSLSKKVVPETASNVSRQHQCIVPSRQTPINIITLPKQPPPTTNRVPTPIITSNTNHSRMIRVPPESTESKQRCSYSKSYNDLYNETKLTLKKVARIGYEHHDGNDALKIAVLIKFPLKGIQEIVESAGNQYKMLTSTNKRGLTAIEMTQDENVKRFLTQKLSQLTRPVCYSNDAMPREQQRESQHSCCFKCMKGTCKWFFISLGFSIFWVCLPVAFVVENVLNKIQKFYMFYIANNIYFFRLSNIFISSNLLAEEYKLKQIKSH